MSAFSKCCINCDGGVMAGCLKGGMCNCHFEKAKDYTDYDRMPKVRNSTFNQLMDELKALHNKKSHDYAADSNVYSNFEFAANFAGLSVEKVFRVMLGIKYARLKELLDSGKEPLNESVQDTIKDAIVYSGLWEAYRRDQRSRDQTKSIFLEGESDKWRFEYDGRHNTLLLVCKAADSEEAVLKIPNVNHNILTNGIDLLTQLDQELHGPKPESSSSDC